MLSALAIKPPTSNPNKKSSWLKKVDMLGSRFSLKHQTTTGKFQTKLGGVSTLILAVITVIVFLVTFSQYFNKEIPVVTTSKEFTEVLHKTNLYDEELIPLFVALSIDRFIEKDIFRFITPVASIQLIIFNETTQVFERKIVDQIKYSHCTNFDDAKYQAYRNKAFKQDVIKRASLCPNLTRIKEKGVVFGTLSDPQYQLVNFNIYPCSLPDKTQCASARELNFIRLSYLQTNKLLTSSNFDEPLRVIPLKSDVNIDTSVTKLMRFKISANKILDDTAQFQDPKLKLEYSSYDIERTDSQRREETLVHCTEEMMAADTYGPCPPYLTLEMRARPQQIIVRRNYKKLSTILGEFGGILKLMSTFALIAFGFYNSRMIKSFILKDFMLFKNFIKKKNLEKEHETIKNRNKVLQLSRPVGIEEEDPAGRLGVITGRRYDKKEVEEVMDQYFKSRISVDDLMRKLNFIDLLQEIFIKKDEEKLVPAVLIATELERVHQAKLARTQSSQNSQKQKEASTRNPKNIFNSQPLKTQKSSNKSPKNSLESIYQSIHHKSLSSENDSIGPVRALILEKLKGLFDVDESFTKFQNKAKIEIKQNQFFGQKIVEENEEKENSVFNNKKLGKEGGENLAQKHEKDSDAFSSASLRKNHQTSKTGSRAESPLRKHMGFKTVGMRMSASPKKSRAKFRMKSKIGFDFNNKKSGEERED